jgi:soluble lytic murein transglycosylase
MLPLVSSAQQTLAKARMALQTGAGNAPALLKAVPASLQNHAGLTLDRIRFRHKRGLNMDMRELFANGPMDPPYADEWWPLRAIAVRESLQAAQYGQAQEIIRRHGALKTEFLAEALWLKGWIGLTYQNNADQAYKDFYRLYNAVVTPVSKSRAAYWAARAAKKNGNGDIARDWLRKAAEYPTVFYGQLAHQEINPGEPLDLPSQPSISESARQNFVRQELPRVIRMLIDAGEQDMADRFIIHLGEQAETPEQFALLADLATSINASHGGVVVAKSAIRKNIILIRAGWPLMPTPQQLEIEPALTHAITRQESEFDNKAQSHANAKGLMQLLPGTASDTARKIGLPFSPPEIWDPVTNVTLGSAYLGRMIAYQGDSYILGIASYNAGPRNVNNWVADFGRPPANEEGAIQWIENIPFGETRNYVQRVLENLQVYRQLLKQSEGGVKLKEDLKR